MPLILSIERVMRWICAVDLFAMMSLVFCDVFSRWAFASPIRGAFEITEVLLVVLIFTGLPLASRWGEHISIDLLFVLLPKSAQHVVARFTQLGVFIVLLGVAWLLFGRAIRIFETGLASPVLSIPYWPFVAYGVLAFCVMALIHLMYALNILQPIAEFDGL